MRGVCMVLCMIHVGCKIYALYSASLVLVWCMYGAFMTKIILKKNNKPVHIAKLKGCGLVQ